MYEVNVFYMSTMQQRCQQRKHQQEQEQQVDPYNMIRTWQAIERERDLYPLPIIATTRELLRNVGLLKYYEEATSLKGQFVFLAHLIRCWSFQEQAFCVGPWVWYRPTKEEIYFNIGLCRRREDFPQFPDVPHGVATEIHLTYTQRHVKPHAFCPSYFQVHVGQLQISSFSIEEVRCLSLLVSTIAHFSSDGKHINCPILYYVDSLIHMPCCI